jgi:hypothetical protein
MRRTLTLVTTLAAVVALTLSGCTTTNKENTVPDKPAIQPPEGTSTDTPEQLLTWTLEQIDDVVTLLGPQGSWKHNGNPPIPWDPDDEEGFVPNVCGSPDPDIMQYDIVLMDRTPVADPNALAQKVRSYWEAQGHTVGQIGPAEHDEGGLLSVTVSLKNKAGFSYTVSTEIQGIHVTSECAKMP